MVPGNAGLQHFYGAQYRRRRIVDAVHNRYPQRRKRLPAALADSHADSDEYSHATTANIRNFFTYSDGSSGARNPGRRIPDTNADTNAYSGFRRHGAVFRIKSMDRLRTVGCRGKRAASHALPLAPETENPTIIRKLCYSRGVHKPFYASGFLYHSGSQQILLQQHSKNETTLRLFGGISRKKNAPSIVFQRYVEKALKCRIPADSIHPVYDYIEDTLGEQFIFFVEVTDVALGAGWFSLSKLNKQTMNEQTRHDVIVGERVIRALSPQT